MKADEEVLRVLLEHGGEHTWDRDAAIKVPRPHGRPGHIWRRNPPPEASFKRLSLAGYVQVETHSVSVWKFGPRDNFAHPSLATWQHCPEVSEYNRREPTWKNRVEIRVALTDRGMQHAASLGLLE